MKDFKEILNIIKQPCECEITSIKFYPNTNKTKIQGHSWFPCERCSTIRKSIDYLEKQIEFSDEEIIRKFEKIKPKRDWIE